jgi:predicted amidophosphoribosyltransferase
MMQQHLLKSDNYQYGTCKIILEYSMSLNKILFSLFPPKCPSCLKNHNGNYIFCNNCFNQLTPLILPLCTTCGTPTEVSAQCPQCFATPPPFEKGISIFPYEGPMGQAIKHGKYGDKSWIFTRLGMVLTPLVELMNPHIIIPVPPSRNSWFKRGFSPPHKLAKSSLVNMKNRKPYIFNQIRRIGGEIPQASLKIKQRKLLKKDAFILDKPIPPGNILIIDDVYTTGATIRALASRIKTESDGQVWFLTLTRTLHHP